MFTKRSVISRIGFGLGMAVGLLGLSGSYAAANGRYNQSIRQIIAFDFCPSSEANSWIRLSGEWKTKNCEYIGSAPVPNPDQCSSSLSQSLVKNVSAKNAEIELDMRSIERVDKAIILRAVDSCNQIQINFRASFFNDVVVQEISDGEFSFHVPPFEVFLPHEMAQTIRVRVRLFDKQLTIWLTDISTGNQQLVMNRAIGFRTQTSGGIGVGVIDSGITAFDNVVVKVLANKLATH